MGPDTADVLDELGQFLVWLLLRQRIKRLTLRDKLFERGAVAGCVLEPIFLLLLNLVAHAADDRLELVVRAEAAKYDRHGEQFVETIQLADLSQSLRVGL